MRALSLCAWLRQSRAILSHTLFTSRMSRDQHPFIARQHDLAVACGLWKTRSRFQWTRLARTKLWLASANALRSGYWKPVTEKMSQTCEIPGALKESRGPFFSFLSLMQSTTSCNVLFLVLSTCEIRKVYSTLSRRDSV